jgi:hypothetical protein
MSTRVDYATNWGDVGGPVSTLPLEPSIVEAARNEVANRISRQVVIEMHHVIAAPQAPGVAAIACNAPPSLPLCVSIGDEQSG